MYRETEDLQSQNLPFQKEIIALLKGVQIRQRIW